jgi:diguanylate cyclase (GGDEF)-like protein
MGGTVALSFHGEVAQRERLLDMSRRLGPTQLRILLLFLAAGALAGPTFGWLLLAPALPGVVALAISQARLPALRRPELALTLSLALLDLGLAAGIATAPGPHVYLLPLLIAPALLAGLLLSVRQASRVVVFSTQAMLAVALGFCLPAVRAAPFALLYPLTVMLAGAGIAMVVARLDLRTRSSAIIDPLTGLPNRLALRARVSELEHQARASHRPVALIVADPDHFKAINDARGHAVGDAVLHEVAARMRAQLHAGASAYRVGGEEFVVLVSDADAGAAVALAERIRSAVCARAIEGLGVMVSFGVAASEAGEGFQFGALFARADRALYEAKRAGGDRVRMWPLASACAAPPRGAPVPAGARPGHDAGAERAGIPVSARAHEDAPPREARGAERRAGERRGLRERRVSGERRRDERPASGDWLVEDDFQRRQLVELCRRLRDQAKPAFALALTLGAATAIAYGWWILPAPAAMAALYVLVEHRVERFRRPEYALGASWVALQASLFASGVVASHQLVFATPLLFVLVIGSSAVFPPRGAALGVALTALLVIAGGFVEDSALVLHAPGILAVDLALLLSAGMLGAAMGRSTIAYRGLGLVDQLTGLFNRAALVSRAAELAARAQSREAPIAVLVADVDRFKAINDTHGHARGDAVLRELGERIRTALRAFDSAYRFGGEEFVVLLDEVDLRGAHIVASRLRAAIAGRSLAELHVTVSVGLAVTRPGEPFDYETIFRRADAALYDAKRAGGDRVAACAGEQELEALSEAPEVQAGLAARSSGADAPGSLG